MTGKIKQALAGRDIILLDTCVWIYHIENHPHYSPSTEVVLNQVANGASRGICSELSLLEIKIHPLKQDREDIANEYEILLDAFPNLTLYPITREVLHRAGLIRARYRLKTPDAIILATGLEQGATLAVTNDRNWRRVEGMDMMFLSDFCR